MTACCVCLVVLAVVVWSWDVNGEHSVRVAYHQENIIVYDCMWRLPGCAGCGCVELGRKR